MRSRLSILAIVAGLACAALAVWLFPRAFPIVTLQQQLTRETALARADSFLAAHQLAPAGARTAVRFERNDSLRTFIELGGGGGDSLNALVRGRDVAPFTWSVRAYEPGNVREARVDFAPDGRIIGFERRLAESDARPTLGVDAARQVAESVLATWIAPRAGTWAPVGASFETRKTSSRVDHTFTFERTDRRIAGAPIRIEAVIAGDTPARVRPYVEVPQSFLQRYGEMRSWNELLALLASLGILGIVIAGMVMLARYARAGSVRWKPAMIVGGVIGAFALAAGLNELPGSWFDYDTAMSPATFRLEVLMLALVFGVSTVLLTGFTLAAAEAATRHAFPRQLDWWKLWRHRGTREVAGQVGGGYVVAAIAFAYVAVFYLVTRSIFGWWVPSELLDDPNQIASPMPWISGLAISLNAAVWEEALFRALPLSLLSLWVGARPRRGLWMAAGVIVSALVFGFAHANYESWPPYSRGVEIFLDACFWAVLFLRFGLLVTIVAHFVYDAVLFGIFAAQGSAVEYRVTAAIIAMALVAPAAVVLWRRVRQGGYTDAPEDARFAAWTPSAAPGIEVVEAPRRAGAMSARARGLAVAAAVAGVVVAVARPPGPTLGPRFTVTRDAVLTVTDSALRARGGNPREWTRLTTIGRDTLTAWHPFLREHDAEEQARRLASTYAIPAWWVVRYVKTAGAATDRIEEWRIRVLPDGRLIDVRHLVPDSLPRDTADSIAVRRIAKGALALAGVDTTVLREMDVTETPRPARRDVTVRYTDTAVQLPAGAAARAWVQIAGDEPLVARRGIELPEAFVREQRGKATNRMAVFGVVMLALLGAIVAGALYVRRRPILVDDGRLTRRQLVLALLILFALMTVSSANAIPSQLYGYDTSQPWNTFLGTTALSHLSAVIFVFVVYGLWNVVAALRRRVGIPLFTGPPAGTRRDMVIAGLGIGGAAFAARGVTAMVEEQGIPPASATTLDALVPWLSGVPDVPMEAVITVAVVAIPALVVVGISRRRILQVAAALVLLAMIAVAVWAMSFTGEELTPSGAIAAVAGLVVVASAILTWGTRTAWSWFVAALAVTALAALRELFYAPVWQARVSAALTALLAAALVALIARQADALQETTGSLTESEER